MIKHMCSYQKAKITIVPAIGLVKDTVRLFAKLFDRVVEFLDVMVAPILALMVYDDHGDRGGRASGSNQIYPFVSVRCQIAHPSRVARNQS